MKPHLPENTPDQVTALRWFALVMVLTSMGLVTVRLLEAEPLRSANDRSRWCTVWSIVERGTYQIDEIQDRPGWGTIDRVKHEEHFYSTKPPILPRMVAEIYRVIRAITGWTLDSDTAAVTRLILFLINILPMGYALWLLARLICRYGRNVPGCVLIIAIACWGTLLTPFLTTFNNHTVAATFLIFSLYAGIKILVEQRDEGWRHAVCGAAAAFTCCNELPAAAYGLAIFGLLARKDLTKTLQWFVPAACIPIAFFVITNYHATGGLKPFYLYYGTEKYVFVHEGIPSYWADPQGVDRNIDSPLSYFVHCTIGHHGMFSLTPVFLLTITGWSMPRLWRQGRLRDFHFMGLVLSLLVFGFYMTKTENYNFGGVSVALRWMLWLIPFWLLALLAVMNEWGEQKWLQVLTIPLLGISLLSAWYPQHAPWTQPWVFDLMTEAKLIDYSTPRPEFAGTNRSWIGTLPTGPETDPHYWIEYACLDPVRGTRILRLSDQGPVVKSNRTLRQIRVEFSLEQSAFDFFVDTELFHASQKADGSPVTLADILWFSDDVTTPVRAEQRAFFQGLNRLPAEEGYKASRLRPAFSALRRDAFMCLIGSSAVRYPDLDGNDLIHSREVWFCQELPFGTLQFEDRIRDGQGGELEHRLWMMQDVGKMNATSPIKVTPPR